MPNINYYYIVSINSVFSQKCYFSGDSLSYHSGKAFSTKDQDNDTWGKSCAVSRKSAWWFGACEDSLLNGPYRKTAVKASDSINWEKFKNGGELALKSAKMMIRPKV